MKLHHTLICCFFLSLQDGNTGLISAQTIIYTGTEGGDVTVRCSCSSSVSRKFFCKEPCEPQDVLIKTNNIRAQKDRYSIQWGRIAFFTPDVSVTIKQLSKSDSGLYRCGCDDRSQSSVEKIEIVVVDAVVDEDSSEVKTISKRTGENITVECSFSLTGNRKYICKDQCQPEDILVETNDFGAERDRYSIRYLTGVQSGAFLYVSITQLTQSDSGRYRCGLDRSLSIDPSQQFDLIVADAPTTSNEPAATQSSDSSPGGSTPPLPETTRDVLLSVGVTLLVLVIISLSVLVFCKRRVAKAKEPLVEPQYASVTETDRVYEDFREDRRNTSPAVEISSAYSYASFTKQNAAGTSDDYSGAHFQNTVEDDSSPLTYSEVDFSKRAFGSSNSAIRGDDNHVVYAVPRAPTASRAEEDPPVYAYVNKH